ncbi:hypothetical protein HU200_053902 [Digitaria exilis]|uniref:Uncharacterized protein n=1 Tax=Digitaria exilis TaxID=1010633 RepID=A0A835E4M4_9POAL|nr:hypothetical protein HU200_053902 [Digitaria exilis]
MAQNCSCAKTIVYLTTFFVVLVIMSPWTFPYCQAGNAPPPPFCFPYAPPYCTNYHCDKVCQEHSFPPHIGYCNKNVNPWECCCPY